MQNEDLRELIEIEREQMTEIVGRIDRLVAQLRGQPHVDADLVVALAAYVHSVYMGVENVLKRLASNAGVELSKSDRWHADLLDMFTGSNPGAVLPLLDPDHRRQLDEMRGFRHVFRVHYA